MSENSFSREMRKATRDVHAISDALVNAKLLFALSNNDVWAEGLLIFYEVFRFLEEAMKRHQKENLGRLLLEGIERTEAFEKDLKFYLGENWTKSYSVRDEVTEYLIYLQRLEDEDSDFLMAFVYHLYMGLLSGGQILKRKKQIKDRLRQNNGGNDGYAITDFGEISIPSLKKEMKEVMDEIAEGLTEEKKKRLLDESKKVFELNNSIIRTVKGAGRILFEMIFFAICIIFMLYIVYLYLF